MIDVTEQAKNQIIDLLKKESIENGFLRVKVKKGGCSGFSYKMDFDTEKTENDKTFTNEKFDIVVDKESLLYLLGMTLDFEGGLNGQGFVFINPNASKTCGCGSSFAV
jgi:iron-sulfur cluster assembly protein